MSISFTTPKFSSGDLQSAIDDARDVIENVDRNRDRVSNDIKNLENYLNECGIKESFRHGFGRGFVVPDENDCDVRASLEETGGAGGEFHEDALVWAPDKKGRYRLLYELSKWQGSIWVDAPGGPYFWDDSSLVRELKPLIETSFEIRKQMYGCLPEFVGALSAHVSVEEPKPEELDLDSIPF